MNCKQGDLAIVVKSWEGNEGKVVRCVSLIDKCWKRLGNAPTWIIDPPLKYRNGNESNTISDIQLRPIRDTEGEDETITWAGKPEKVTQ